MNAIYPIKKAALAPAPPLPLIEFLPNELFLYLLSFLDFSGVAAASLVSHRWRVLALDTLEHSWTLPAHKSEQVIYRISDLCAKNKSLRFMDLAMRSFPGIGKRFSNFLKHLLEIDGHRTSITALRLNLLASNRLSLSSYNAIANTALHQITCSPQLKDLDLAYFFPSQFPDKPLQLTSLKALTLNYCSPYFLQWDAFCLTRIDLSSTEVREPDLVALIEKSSPILRHLSLKHLFPSPRAETLLPVLRGATALRSLSLTISEYRPFPNAVAASAAYADYFSHHTTLTSLSFLAFPLLLTPPVIQAIAQHGAHLTFLNLSLLSISNMDFYEERCFNTLDFTENTALHQLKELNLVNGKIKKEGERTVESIAIKEKKVIASTIRGPIPYEPILLAAHFPHALVRYTTVYHPARN